MLIFKGDSRESVLQWLMKGSAPSSLSDFASYGTGWSDHVAYFGEAPKRKTRRFGVQSLHLFIERCGLLQKINKSICCAFRLIVALFHAIGRLGSEVKLITTSLAAAHLTAFVCVELYHASVIWSVSRRSASPNLTPSLWDNKFRAQKGRPPHQMGTLE